MYEIRDALGNIRGLRSQLGLAGMGFDTSEEAIEYAHENVDINPEYPEEYPFSVVNKDTGEVVHQWHLPGPY